MLTSSIPILVVEVCFVGLHTRIINCMAAVHHMGMDRSRSKAICGIITGTHLVCAAGLCYA